jgi:hypothetical protein
MNRIADIYLNALFDIVVNRNWSSMNSIPVIDTSVNGDSINNIGEIETSNEELSATDTMSNKISVEKSLKDGMAQNDDLSEKTSGSVAPEHKYISFIIKSKYARQVNKLLKSKSKH